MSKQIKIGFDLGNHSLKIAAVRPGGVDFHEIPLPEHLMEADTVTMPHAFSVFLKKTRKNLRLPTGPAGLILPSSQVLCRLVTMPRMTEEQLMLNLPHEFSDFVRGETHLYHCDYAMCREVPEDSPQEDEPQMTMMAAVARKQQVQEYIRMFAAGGFALRQILPQEMALIQLAEAFRRSHPDAPEEFCFIDLGYLSTRAFVIQGDRIQVTRRIPTGCRELDGVIGDILNVDSFLADSYKRGNYQEILENPRCVEVYEHIAVELLKLVNFYHYTYRRNQLKGVYLMGGGAETEPLCRTLTDTLGLPALPVQDLLPGTAEEGTGAPFVSVSGLMAAVEEE